MPNRITDIENTSILQSLNLPDSVSTTSNLLKNGCYYTTYQPKRGRNHFHGTLRFGFTDGKIVISGDLYKNALPSGNNDLPFLPAESGLEAKIPIFELSLYHFYLRCTGFEPEIPQSPAEPIKHLNLGFVRYKYNKDFHSWDEGNSVKNAYTARLENKRAPNGYPALTMYFEGEIFKGDKLDGTFSMGWISPFFRRAQIEIDKVKETIFPTISDDIISGEDWRQIFKMIDWDIEVKFGVPNITAPPDRTWNKGELHSTMVSQRTPEEISQIDKEWRYYLLCVHRFASEEDEQNRNFYGLMFDRSHDKNKRAREGAAIFSHTKFSGRWQNFHNFIEKELHQERLAYLRTAIHEISHAMGLLDDNETPMIMCQTDGLPLESNGKKFPGNINWFFSPDDQHRLRHMPDIWLRPGGIGWHEEYERNIKNVSNPIGAGGLILQEEQNAPPLPTLPEAATAALSKKENEQHLIDNLFRLSVTATYNDQVNQPVRGTFPFGTPVRLNLKLLYRKIKGIEQSPLQMPADFGLTTGNVTISVRKKFRREVHRVQPMLHACNHQSFIELQPGDSIYQYYTLLYGNNKALFPEPGKYKIEITTKFRLKGGPQITLNRIVSVEIIQPLNLEQERITKKILKTPALAQLLVFGGDHLQNEILFLQEILNNDVLGPHFAIIEARRWGNRFFERPKNYDEACTVMKKFETFIGPEKLRHLQLILTGAELQFAARLVYEASFEENYQTDDKKLLLIKELVEMLKNKSKSMLKSRVISRRTKGNILNLLNSVYEDAWE